MSKTGKHLTTVPCEDVLCSQPAFSLWGSGVGGGMGLRLDDITCPLCSYITLPYMDFEFGAELYKLLSMKIWGHAPQETLEILDTPRFI